MSSSNPSNKGATERARQYKRAQILFFIAGIAFSWITAAMFVFSGSSRKLAKDMSRSVQHERVAEGATAAGLLLISWIISLPLAYLRGYRLEHRYEMSNQSTGQWFGEQLKGLGLQLVLMVPIAQLMLGVIRQRPRDWWAALSAMAIPFTVILSHLAPILILPLFNTYQPLRDRELAERLKALAARSGIHVAEILEMDMSRQTRAANAFVAGIGSSKRIVLADTLLEELTHDEIETVVAHEIAHQANRDIWRFLAAGTIKTTLIAWATYRAFDLVQARTERRTGIRGAGYVEALPLLSLIGSVIGVASLPIDNAYSRSRERKADEFALQLTGKPDAFKSALEKISTNNLVDPDPSRLEEILLHSHPSMSDRGAACDRFAERQTTN